MVSLLVQGDQETIAAAARNFGGYLKYSVEDIASINLPLNKVKELSAIAGIKRIEGLYGNGQLLDDMTFVNANVTAVHEGYAPLLQGYDGSGVSIAVLDDGIDFHHPDFINPDGTTRVKFLWDQNATSGGTLPFPYEYGQEWDATAINSGQCTHVEPISEFGHGSNVAGNAAGNGLAINNFYGVAPAADLIIVAVRFDENFLNNVVDATNYAFEKAASMNEPCVINASIGTYLGSHDGYDLPAQMIDDLITQQEGRSFVCAAGNGGNVPFHLGYETQPDSSFTWFSYNASLGQIFYEWWIDKEQATDFEFAVGVDNTAPFEFLGRTSYFNLLTDFDLSSGVDTLKDTLWNGTTRLGIITIYVYELDSTYACDVIIKPDFTTYYWRFITNGTGRFDLWSSSGLTGTADLVSTGLPLSSDFPDIERYRLPDNNETIVSSFTCSDKVISTANFINRNEYIDYYGTLQLFPTDITGALAPSSSFGPTRDGRLKPDISAPGNRTLSTGLIPQLNALILSQPYKVALGGMHNSNGGTSLASPVVAGIAVLYFQKNPLASWKEVQDAIHLSAREDDFTGNALPDFKWGFGKVDAFGTMTINIVYGCTDPFSINYNPDATVDDGSCIPIIFGCTNADAINYNPLANMDDGSCYYTGISETSATAGFIECYPNPAGGATTFYFHMNEKNATIVISDLSGKEAGRISVTNDDSHISYHNHLSPGLYFYHLENGNFQTSAKKLFIF